MDIKSKHKADASFSMSSMTDIVFLLLIFFMLTSTFVTPTSLPINLPGTEGAITPKQTVQVHVTKDVKYYVDEQEVTLETLKNKVRRKLSSEDTKNDVVMVYADKDIKYDEVMKVAGLLSQLEVRISLATKSQN